MPAKSPSSFLPLSEPVLQILLSLSDADRHGYGILQDIEARTGRDEAVGTSTLYAAIGRLLKEGLLAEVEAEGGSSGGPPRRTFHITGLGRRVLLAEVERLDALARMAAAKGLWPQAGPGSDPRTAG